MSELTQEENVSKATMTAVFAAIVAAAAPGAYAQTNTMPATRAAVTSHIIQSDEVRASKMIGSTSSRTRTPAPGSRPHPPLADISVDKQTELIDPNRAAASPPGSFCLGHNTRKYKW